MVKDEKFVKWFLDSKRHKDSVIMKRLKKLHKSAERNVL